MTSWRTACWNATADRIAEVIKEIFGKLGYKSGGRFFDENQDPAVTGLKAMVAQLEQRLAMKQDPELAKVWAPVRTCWLSADLKLQRFRNSDPLSLSAWII